jgi:hypothetical protein
MLHKYYLSECVPCGYREYIWLIRYRRPNETTLAVHRQKIRELMIEKEAYTQRYLAEKHKYDALLAKVNSTSTLGSISTTLSSTLVPESSTTCIHADEHVSSTQVKDLAHEITPCLLAPSHHVVNSNGGAPPRDRPLDSSHAASPPQDVQARSISAARATTALSQKQLSKSNELTTESTQPKPSNRNKALKIARRVARGTGYVVAGTAAVVLFPITIVVFVIYRRRRAYALPALPAYRMAMSEISLPPDELGAYSSALIPAELPAVHELTGDVEMGLVGALTRISPRQGRTEDYRPARLE